MITPAFLLRLPIWVLSRPRYLAPVLGAVSLAALACSSAGPSDIVPSTTQPAKDAPVTATAEPAEVATVVPSPTATSEPAAEPSTVVLSPTATSEPVAEVENDTTAGTGGDLASATAEPSPVSRDVGEAVKGSDSKAGQDGPLAAILRELNPAGPKVINSQLYQQLLPRDAIFPIYEPTLGGPEDATLDPAELVIGVSIGGESRAYPIRPLRFREIVNDELGGVPILVTW